MKCSAEAKIFCFYDAQMSHKHHRIQSPSTVLSWGHADFPGSGCWNGWAETKSVQGEQLGGRHFSAASAQRSLQYGALLLTEITDTKNQMMPVACTLDMWPALLLLWMQNWQWKWQSYSILLLLLLSFSLSSKFPKPCALQFMWSWRVGHD